MKYAIFDYALGIKSPKNKGGIQLTMVFMLVFLSVKPQSWVWTDHAGSMGYDAGRSIAVDNQGNTYVCGYFDNSVTFGSNVLASNGSADIFLVKYDPLGNVLWAHGAGGSDADQANAIAVDNNGNCYLTGTFSSNTIQIGSFTLSKTGDISDVFVLKYSASGNPLWAKSAGGENNDVGNAIAVDDNGNCLLTGSFYSSIIHFGSLALSHTGSGGSDMFVVKYSSNGNELWTLGGSGNTSDEAGNAIAVDKQGNVCVAGYFYNHISFAAYSLTDAGAGDIFLLKTDSSGTVLWAKSEGGNNLDNVYGIDADQWGNIYITGEFYDNISIGSTSLVNNGNGDMLVAKYDALGNNLWAHNAGGAAIDGGAAIATDNYGNCYVSGFFDSDSIRFGTYKLNNSGSSDLFIARYNSSGTVTWAQQGGGAYFDEVWDIASDNSNGTVYVCGAYSTSVTFGIYSFLSNGLNDIFVARARGFTDLPEYDATNGSVVFPNPACGQLYVNSPVPLTHASISFNDVLGRTQLHINGLNGELLNINCTQIPRGIYFVQLKEQDKLIAQWKIMISED